MDDRFASGTRRRGHRTAVSISTAMIMVILVDAAAKAWAESALRDGPDHLGVLDLVLGANSGVAFGVGAGSPRWIILTVTAIVLGVLVFVATRLRPAFPAGLVVGGGAANLLDRIRDGQVTDFISIGWWPTFNLADCAVCLGVFWLVVANWRTNTSPSGAVHPR